MIALINYDRGNLRSVRKALETAGARAEDRQDFTRQESGVELVDDPARLADDDVHAVVLPGVGAFGDAARNLRSRGLWEPVRDWIRADKPFLGICLGYQLLFESSEETPGIEGLGIFPGKVVRFPEKSDTGLKVPHMGWNRLQLTQPECPLWQGLPQGHTNVYFVHSYYPAPDDAGLVSARAGYGIDFAAAIARGNCFATQFHPEKSQAVGIKMLRNFVEHCARVTG
jgi:glutamine amidotransferase